MTREEIAARAARIINDHLAIRISKEPPTGALTEATHLVQDLRLDSLDEIEIIMALEEAFEIEIADQQAEELTTYGDLLDLIAEMLAVPA